MACLFCSLTMTWCLVRCQIDVPSSGYSQVRLCLAELPTRSWKLFCGESGAVWCAQDGVEATDPVSGYKKKKIETGVETLLAGAWAKG